SSSKSSSPPHDLLAAAATPRIRTHTPHSSPIPTAAVPLSSNPTTPAVAPSSPKHWRSPLPPAPRCNLLLLSQVKGKREGPRSGETRSTAASARRRRPGVRPPWSPSSSPPWRSDPAVGRTGSRPPGSSRGLSLPWGIRADCSV
uniref:Uncharacterized protein n=1 Tax=Aegilops tauschii subsp. strangulata TaxID=200361 RepID=A0A452XNJ1_AEGTS